MPLWISTELRAAASRDLRTFDPRQKGSGLQTRRVRFTNGDEIGGPEVLVWSHHQNGFSDAGWHHFTVAYRIVSTIEIVPGANGNESSMSIFEAVASINGITADTVKKSAKDHGWHDPSSMPSISVMDLIKKRAERIPDDILKEIFNSHDSAK